jgi:hypothetical protein
MATGDGYMKSVASRTDETKSTEGLNLEIIQGEVLMVYPGLGVYLVLPKHGDAASNLLTCCSISGSLGRSGVRGSDVYEAGDDVLVACHRVADTQDLIANSTGDLGYIMCPAPPDFMSSAQGYPSANIHGESLDYYNQLVTDAFASTKQIINTVKDLSFGLPNDTFGGDYVKYGPLHTFLAVCATKTSIGSSPMACLETFAFHDMIRRTARAFQDRSTSVESGREPDEGEMLYYERLSMTEREGMGAIGTEGDSPFTIVGPGIINPTAENLGETQLGVFRHSRLRGKSGDGDIEALSRPFEDEGLHTDGINPSKPVGKVSVRQTYDGRHETRAAGGIDHVKTAYIPVPEQIKQHDKDTPNDFNPEDPYDEAFQTSDSDPPFSAFSSTLENQEFDQDTEKFRNSRTNARSDYWQTLTREELAEKYPDLDIENAPKQMEALDTTKPFYDEPPSVTEKDPVTELERRLYALESIIRQQPDGTIVISDGSGSEILMHRGRITISPAADLELRPGRDCFELVPRRKVINANEEVQIVSNDGGVRIKAENNVDVLAGNGGVGRILIESRAETGFLAEDPSGIILRSETDLRAMGTDLYFGLLPPNNTNPQDANTSGLERGRTGTVIIDARGGDVGIHGNSLYSRMQSGVSFSAGNALMAIAGGVYTVVATRGQMAMPLEIGITEEGSIDQYVLDEHGVSLDVLEQQGSIASLRVAGQFVAAGAIFQGVVSAGSMSAAGAAFGNASLLSGLFGGEIEPPQVRIDPFSVASLSTFADAYARNAQRADLTDENLLKAWFQFDKRDDVDQKDFIMYEMRWQAMLGVGGATNTWDQKAVKNFDGEDSYAYPGYGEDDAVLVSAELGKRPMKDYIVNTESKTQLTP